VFARRLEPILNPPHRPDQESFLLLEFYSGAAGPPGRFGEGFLLRRLQIEADCTPLELTDSLL